MSYTNKYIFVKEKKIAGLNHIQELISKNFRGTNLFALTQKYVYWIAKSVNLENKNVRNVKFNKKTITK